MDGYLLDTNTITFWWRKEAKVLEHISALAGKAPILMSVVSLGEVEYGHRVVAPDGETPVQTEYKEFIRDKFPYPLDFSKTTTQCYGVLRARLFQEFAPREKKNKGLLPEQLVDPVTGKELGIQENDLWIAAQAVERNLVLVTHDAMARIRGVANELIVVDWMH
ncbi:MAG: hypothetical protein ABSE73_11720 [Planctomycetota bacterium]